MRKKKHSKMCIISQGFQKHAMGFSFCVCGKTIKNKKK